jgi:hypothetical protein
MVPRCKAQQSFPVVTYDEYGWTSDMKRVSMTTPDIGLTFKITLYDNTTKPYDSALTALYIYINIFNNIVSNGLTQSNPVMSKTFTFDSTNELYLPAGESSSFFVAVGNINLGNSQLAIGSYTADLSYSNSPLVYGAQGTPMGQYPFNFQVETAQVLKQEIAQNPSPTSLNVLVLAFAVMIIIAVVVSVVTTYVIVAKTKWLSKRRQKSVFFGSLTTVLTLLFAGISLGLQIIRW